MTDWSGVPQGWDKAAVPWRQTIFLPRGAAGIERLQSVRMVLTPTMVEQQRQAELSGDYELMLEYTSAAQPGLQQCEMRLPFKVVLPAWWKEMQADKLRVDAVNTETEVLAPQIVELRARLLVQPQNTAADTYRPSVAAEKLLKEYEDVIKSEKVKTEREEHPVDLAALKAAALGRLHSVRPAEAPAKIEGEKEEMATEQTILTQEIAEETAMEQIAEAAVEEQVIAETEQAETEVYAEPAVADVAIEAEEAEDESADAMAESVLNEDWKKFVQPRAVIAADAKPVSVYVPEPLPDDGSCYRLRFVRGDEGWQQM